jgi:transposase-like protein
MKIKSLLEFCDKFKNDAVCLEYYKQIKYKNGCFCPFCGHKEIYTFYDGKRYKCKTCSKQFTLLVGTIFQGSKIGLRKWFIAMYLMSSSKNGVSSLELAKHLGGYSKNGMVYGAPYKINC